MRLDGPRYGGGKRHTFKIKGEEEKRRGGEKGRENEENEENEEGRMMNGDDVRCGENFCLF